MIYEPGGVRSILWRSIEVWVDSSMGQKGNRDVRYGIPPDISSS